MRKLFVLVFSAITIVGQTVYVRDGGTGDGSAWNNALDELPSSLVRGATYYIADGTYPGYTFDDNEDGTSLITVKKAIDSDHGTEIGWLSSYGDGQAVFTGGFNFLDDYYRVDGQTRNESNWKADSAYGFYITSITSSDASFARNGSHVTILYASIGDAYSETYASGMDTPIALIGNSDTVLGFTFTRCFVHNGIHTLFQFSGASSGTVEYCFIGPGWGKEAIRGQSTASSWIIRHNTFYDSTQTDPEDGTSGITAEIGVWSGTHDNWQVYGNTFSNSKSGGRNSIIVIGGDGTSWIGSGATGVKVYNNTFAGIAESASFSDILINGTGEVINNLGYSVAGGFNVSASTTANNGEAGADPFVNYATLDLRLSGATSPGTSLASPYDTDPLGTTRGGDGTWDVGAFEYDSGGGGGTTGGGGGGGATANVTTLNVGSFRAQ